MPATKEELKVYNRYELITVSPHFGQAVVGIYQHLKEVKDAYQLKLISQDIPLVIYDTIKQERIKL